MKVIKPAPGTQNTFRLCVACIGDGTDPAEPRNACLRCTGSGIDPDPLAPVGLLAS